jgi:hypothetical protein
LTQDGSDVDSDNQIMLHGVALGQLNQNDFRLVSTRAQKINDSDFGNARRNF